MPGPRTRTGFLNPGLRGSARGGSNVVQLGDAPVVVDLNAALFGVPIMATHHFAFGGVCRCVLSLCRAGPGDFSLGELGSGPGLALLNVGVEGLMKPLAHVCQALVFTDRVRLANPGRAVCCARSAFVLGIELSCHLAASLIRDLHLVGRAAWKRHSASYVV